MPGVYQAYIEIGYQGRLRQSDILLQTEVFFFKQMLESYGLDATDVPNLSVLSDVEHDAVGRELSRRIELKLRGVWTPIRVETRAPGVFVIHD